MHCKFTVWSAFIVIPWTLKGFAEKLGVAWVIFTISPMDKSNAVASALSETSKLDLDLLNIISAISCAWYGLVSIEKSNLPSNNKPPSAVFILACWSALAKPVSSTGGNCAVSDW